jgi:hypothetical protein
MSNNNNNNNNNTGKITNIIKNSIVKNSNNMINKSMENVSNGKVSKDTIEKCKTIMQSVQIMPMFSPKNIVIGAIGTFIPWVIILIIAGIIIII